MKYLIIFTSCLILASCQDEYTPDELLQTQVSMLKIFCDQRQPCLDKVDLLSEACPTKQDEQSIPEGMDAELSLSAAFQFCIVKEMDEAFMKQFNQAFPVKETNVQISGVSDTAWGGISYAFQNDSSILPIEEKQGKFIILNQYYDIEGVKNFIKQQDWSAGPYQSVVLISNDQTDMGLILEMMEIFKKSNIENSIARKERLAEFTDQ